MHQLWFAARIAPQKERLAHECLTRQGFMSFYAHEIKEVRVGRHSGSTKRIKRAFPLLPAYALVAHDGTDHWFARATVAEWPIVGGRVLKAWIGANGRPAPIRVAAIEHLMEISGRDVAQPDAPALSAGAIARITAGPFAGHVGKVETIRGAEARMLLHLFGSEREIGVQASALEAA